MANILNDDVVELLSVTGSGASTYRSFSNGARNIGGSPLAKAVFATAPEAPEPTLGHQLRSNVERLVPPAAPSPMPAATNEARQVRRALSDLMNVLASPARPRADQPAAAGLQSLFQRLDR